MCVFVSFFSSFFFHSSHIHILPGRVAQSVTCLATDACLTADLGSRVRSRSGTILS